MRTEKKILPLSVSIIGWEDAFEDNTFDIKVSVRNSFPSNFLNSHCSFNNQFLSVRWKINYDSG